MSVRLQPDGFREISSANHITLVNPTLHPDRIMTEHDFLYILSGTWEIGEDGVCYSMRSDDLLILPAGRHHYGISPCSPNNRHMYIHAKPLENDGTGDEGSACFSSLIHCGGNPRIRDLFEEIIAQQWSDSRLRTQKLSLLFNLFLCELLEQQDRPAASQRSRNIPEEISRQIRTSPQTFFTAKELAEQYYVCERTLSNLFKKAYGKTLYAYQMDIKLEMVRQFLISQPDVKLHETALNFGFCDEFHLSRSFSRRYGISPGRYREQNRPAAEAIRPAES